jgi:hypothetical protein
MINNLKNIWIFAGYGAFVMVYIYLMNWSLMWYIMFRETYRRKRYDPNMGKVYRKYYWRELVSIPVYLLTWSLAIVIVMALIGGFSYFILNLLINTTNVLGV